MHSFLFKGWPWRELTSAIRAVLSDSNTGAPPLPKMLVTSIAMPSAPTARVKVTLNVSSSASSERKELYWNVFPP